jgi:hypothetical protein
MFYNRKSTCSSSSSSCCCVRKCFSVIFIFFFFRLSCFTSHFLNVYVSLKRRLTRPQPSTMMMKLLSLIEIKEDRQGPAETV